MKKIINPGTVYYSSASADKYTTLFESFDLNKTKTATCTISYKIIKDGEDWFPEIYAHVYLKLLFIIYMYNVYNLFRYTL